MNRRSAEQTRQLLLDTAVQILHEKGPAAGVLHVRLSDVVARAGLTTGAAYRLWDDQQDFHDALAVAAMRWRDRSMLARTTNAAFAVVAQGGRLEDLLRAAGAANVQALPADNGIMTTLALRAAAYNQPSLLHASAERSQDMTASFGALYRELLRTYRLRMCAPFTLEHLSAGMSALVDGFGVQTACGELHPEVVLEDGRWTLLGVCLTALVRHMTEPDAPVAAADGPDAAADGPVAAADGPDAAADGPDAAADGPAAAADAPAAPADAPDAAADGPDRSSGGRRVRIVHLTGPVFDALAAGDLGSANAASPVPLSDYFAGPDWRAVWTRRRDQVREDPGTADWVTGVIWDEQRGIAVGRAGFHGPPDAAGMVEIGYAVDPAFRRRGYARAALESLLHRAAREPAVRTVRVTISPANTASSGLVSQYGFAVTGEQWDEEDGWETIYEISAGDHR